MADISFSVKMEGLETTLANMETLSRATQKNTVRKTLKEAGEPLANLASHLAPHKTGILSFSIVVATQLTRRHKAEQRDKQSEVEVYIGPSGGQGALFYASHQEFGTIVSPAHPYMRPAWESDKLQVYQRIVTGLERIVDKAAQRAARKAARLKG